MHHLEDAVMVSGISSLFLAIIHIGSSYTIVELNDNSIEVRNLWKVMHLKRLDSIKTWWCYDYGISSIELGEGTQGKSRALTNKINCFIKCIGDNEELFLYEQIHLGDKFPNNHEYLPNEEINKSLMIRIWDIDKCLEKLQLASS